MLLTVFTIYVLKGSLQGHCVGNLVSRCIHAMYTPLSHRSLHTQCADVVHAAFALFKLLAYGCHFMSQLVADIGAARMTSDETRREFAGRALTANFCDRHQDIPWTVHATIERQYKRSIVPRTPISLPQPAKRVRVPGAQRRVTGAAARRRRRAYERTLCWMGCRHEHEP